MTLVLDIARFALRQSARHFLSQLNGEGAVLFAVPEAHGYIDIFQTKSPGARVNFGIGHYSPSGSAPGAALAFETCFERG